MLRACGDASRSGHEEAYCSSRAKHQCKLHIEDHFINADPCRKWQWIQEVTDYKPKSTTTPTNNANSANELNSFYAQFDLHNKEPTTKIVPLPPMRSLTLDCRHLSRAMYDIPRAVEG